MKPILQALVLADKVYQDVNGKKIIVGTFSRYRFTKKSPMAEVHLPDGTTQRMIAGGMNAGSPSAYVSLTDVCEGTVLQLQFLNLTKHEVLIGTEVKLGNVDRLGNIEINFPLPPLPITEAGVYALQIMCEGEILGSWRVVAEDMDAKKKENNTDDADAG